MNIRLAILLAIIGILAMATVIVAPHPIPQDQRYHHFADTRPFAGIPNFANVASSVLFVVPGLVGLATLPRLRRDGVVVILCVGAMVTGAGSAVYHWNPSDASLVLDRLGIVIVIAAFIALLMAEFDVADSRLAFSILLLAGISSLLCWVYLGDLRPYGVFQGFPLILFLVGSVFFPRMHARHGMLWLATIGYVLAKVCEFLDQTVYGMGGVVSGHTLKHVLAGVALWITVEWLLHPMPATTSKPLVAAS